MAEIMTTKELAKYLKLHEITIGKYAARGEIPAIRIGRVWRFDKEAIDNWIKQGQEKATKPKPKAKSTRKAGGKKKAASSKKKDSQAVVYKLKKKGAKKTPSKNTSA